MAVANPEVVRLSDLKHGQEAVCFAALVKKERNVDKHDKPYVKCTFRDKRQVVVAPFWASNSMREVAETWTEGMAYRLVVRGTWNVRYGMQVEVFEARPANDEDDAADGYSFHDLVEGTDRDPEDLWRRLHDCIEKSIDDPKLKQLVLTLLDDNAALFKKMPAATNFHHGYTGGLLEHVWSMTRIAVFASKHYAEYYWRLNPPLNKCVVVAATVLHDIGKLRELDYHPVEAKYTTPGCLIGHVLIGRDMVRDAAKAIDGFDPETLLLLEHAILAHHGRREYGAPVLPQTMEALMVSFIDDLDAKMNIAARGRLLCHTDGEFTDKVYALDNRRFYKGVPTAPPDDDADADVP